MMGTFGRRGEVLFSAVGFQLLVGVPGHVPGYPQGAPIRGLNDNLDILGHRADKLPPPVLVGRQSWVGITAAGLRLEASTGILWRLWATDELRLLPWPARR